MHTIRDDYTGTILGVECECGYKLIQGGMSLEHEAQIPDGWWEHVCFASKNKV